VLAEKHYLLSLASCLFILVLVRVFYCRGRPSSSSSNLIFGSLLLADALMSNHLNLFLVLNYNYFISYQIGRLKFTTSTMRRTNYLRHCRDTRDPFGRFPGRIRNSVSYWLRARSTDRYWCIENRDLVSGRASTTPEDCTNRP